MSCWLSLISSHFHFEFFLSFFRPFQRKTNAAGDEMNFRRSRVQINFRFVRRAHDNCYPQIAPGACLKSICNNGVFTRLHCGLFDCFSNDSQELIKYRSIQTATRNLGSAWMMWTRKLRIRLGQLSSTQFKSRVLTREDRAVRFRGKLITSVGN